MKNATLISVVIPAYNAGQFLDEILESVLSQTYENWECIIVNDGSTDNTESVVKKWCEKDARFRYFYKENSGASDTRNFGIKETRGEYIAFLDADDLYLPEYLEFCLKTLIEQDLDLVAPKMMDFKNRPNKIPENDNNEGHLFYGKQGIRDFLYRNQITITILCKKSVLEVVGGFSWHDRAEDLHCWLKMLFAGYKIYRVRKYMAYRRMHQNSWSSGDYDCSKEVIKIIHSFKQKILDNNINYYQYFNRWAKKNIIISNDYNTKKYNIWGGIKHINNLEANYLPFRFIIKIVKEKLFK